MSASLPPPPAPPEIESLPELAQHLARGLPLAGAVLQSLDLRGHTAALCQADLRGTVFLGCQLEPGALFQAQQNGALIFPRLPQLPYDPYRGALYSPQELSEGFGPGAGASYADSLDGRIHAHYLATGGATPPSVLEALARRLHDHAITDALQELIAGQQVVAVMGGHALRRDDAGYLPVARIAWRLAAEGFLLASGGGPGAMEATHLGAALAPASEAALAAAAQALARTPAFEPRERWLRSAQQVAERLLPGTPGPSLGVPTWLYGHEPPTLFATHIAKYFANSVREEGLLTVARAGVIFTPGSAGTIQEVFQDATQNHYQTGGPPSPMVFFGRRFWTEQKPVYPLLARLAAGQPYADRLLVTDDAEQVVRALCDHREAAG